MLSETLSPQALVPGRVSIRTLYLAASLRALPPVCRVVEVPPLLRELVLHAVREAPLDLAEPRHARLIGVLLDQLRTPPAAGLSLPEPTDPRAAAVARRLRDDPGGATTVDALAREAGVSRRTLERLFLEGTGLTPDRWRRRMRMLLALRLLAERCTATQVSIRVGYSTPAP